MREGSSVSRALRAVAWVLAALGGTVLLAVVGLPLIIRGPTLARVVENVVSRRVCGSVTLKGGHIGIGVVPALLFQRPFRVALDGIEIREPDGNYLIAARTVRFDIAFLRHPWRMVVERG